MESARVELRKLQLLNDRINQCLDALHQVRLSVHGLSHTTAPFAGSQPSTPQLGPIGQVMDPRFGWGGVPFQGQPTGPTGYFGGLSHTPFTPSPFAQQSPFTQSPFAQGSQLGTFGQIPQPGFGQIPQIGPFGAGAWPMGGLSHTGAEPEAGYNRPLWADPVLAAKVRETFPFVQYPLPPAVSVY